MVGAGRPLAGFRRAIPRIRSADPRIRSADPRIRSADPRIRSADPRIRSADPRIRSADPRIRSADPRIRSATPCGRPGREGIRAASSPAERRERRPGRRLHPRSGGRADPGCSEDSWMDRSPMAGVRAAGQVGAVGSPPSVAARQLPLGRPARNPHFPSPPAPRGEMPQAEGGGGLRARPHQIAEAPHRHFVTPPPAGKVGAGGFTRRSPKGKSNCVEDQLSGRWDGPIARADRSLGRRA